MRDFTNRCRMCGRLKDANQRECPACGFGEAPTATENVVTRDDLAAPPGLTRRGQQAYDIIRQFLHDFGRDPEEDPRTENALEYTGGCRTFYSPQEWRDRGEYGGERAVLIVVYDGGDVGYAFDYDHEQYAIVDKMAAQLGKAGFMAEPINNWSCAIYDERATQARERAQNMMKRRRSR